MKIDIHKIFEESEIYLSDMACVDIVGDNDNAKQFLDGQVTSDIALLSDNNKVQLSSICNQKGYVVCDFFLIWEEGFKIGSTNELRKKFKNWNPQVAIYQIKNLSEYKNLHYIKRENSLELYDPISVKYEKNFEIIEEKISQLPSSILEIIFYQSNIAIVWNEMLGTEELLRIKEAILKI